MNIRQAIKRLQRQGARCPGYLEGGEKELARGVRLYEVPSRTNGKPIVQLMSKSVYENFVEYRQGED